MVTGPAPLQTRTAHGMGPPRDAAGEGRGRGADCLRRAGGLRAGPARKPAPRRASGLMLRTKRFWAVVSAPLHHHPKQNAPRSGRRESHSARRPAQCHHGDAGAPWPRTRARGWLPSAAARGRRAPRTRVARRAAAPQRGASRRGRSGCRGERWRAAATSRGHGSSSSSSSSSNSTNSSSTNSSSDTGRAVAGRGRARAVPAARRRAARAGRDTPPRRGARLPPRSPPQQRPPPPRPPPPRPRARHQPRRQRRRPPAAAAVVAARPRGAACGACLAPPTVRGAACACTSSYCWSSACRCWVRGGGRAAGRRHRRRQQVPSRGGVLRLQPPSRCGHQTPQASPAPAPNAAPHP
jgi:hypothetical protein